MNFDEWWNDQQAGAPAMVFNTEEDMARTAWNTASRIEREECANICENQTDYYGGQDYYATGCLDCSRSIRSKA